MRLSLNSTAIEIIARLGYGARGMVFCLLGGVAMIAALSSGQQAIGARSLFSTLRDQPFGRVFLLMIASGFAFFAIWRFVETIADTDRRGHSWTVLMIRAARLLGGMSYLGFGLLAFWVGVSGMADGNDGSVEQWTAWLLRIPFGSWLLALIGLVVAAAGLMFAWKGWRGEVAEHLSLDGRARRWVVPIARFGYAARGLAFVLIGGFVILAALRGQMSSPQGPVGALESLQTHPYGWILLGVTASGLLAFGIFGLLQAWYHRIDP